MRQLVDGSGQVTLAQGTRPFGAALWQAGSGSSGFGFTGEQVDASTGLVFLRARYYDAGEGRFLSLDAWRGDVWRPGTLNRYVYVLNDPINGIDPSGHTELDPGGAGDLCEWEKYGQNRDWYCYVNPDCSACQSSAGKTFEFIGNVLGFVARMADPIDYAVTGYECVTEGCSVWDVGLTVLPAATPLWRGVGKVGKGVLRFCDSTVGRLLGRHLDEGIDVVHHLDDGFGWGGGTGPEWWDDDIIMYCLGRIMGPVHLQKVDSASQARSAGEAAHPERC